ncbi:hypothetical protein TL16_g07478 [Triparma laevis f. inornata]|uniref:Major facilitator superfamily (MFS) profile domain-containing protein n=1 Tax=Triparma laevis f. inornata TaxID=1714386 RepID=A0A9W7ATY5_9STRA|nr:hypothetical protein TL16_g07478 [Triparma laevis f. inornata]
MTDKEVYSLLNLKDFTKDEITSKLSLLSDSDEITPISIKSYLNNDLANKQIGRPEESTDLIVHRIHTTLNQNGSLHLPTVSTHYHTKSSSLDLKALAPITTSMLLVGSCVGMITPIMPYIVSNLSLSTQEFGYVISAFGLAKLIGNIPSAILVERHGRKPYLVYSLLAVGAGTAGIGFAGGLEELIACRLAIGFGVASLSTAATLSITDMSTNNNRASTMAPVMAAFAAGTALGPAVGGMLADSVGLEVTFSLVGGAFLANSVLNGVFLSETQSRRGEGSRFVDDINDSEEIETVADAFKNAVGQWKPLMQVRSSEYDNYGRYSSALVAVV